MATLKKVPGERGLYVNPDSGTYFVRIQTDGRDTFLSLETTRKSIAINRRDARRAAKAAAKLGLAFEDPDEAKPPLTVAEVIRKYQEDGYRDRKGRVRPDGRHQAAEEAHCETLLEFFDDDQPASDLRQKMVDDYHDWRVERVATGEGHRTTDVELQTLANAFEHAKRKELVNANPLTGRMRYHSASGSRHCRELAPENTDELHQIAGHLFEHRPSEVLGWQALFEAMTGLRTSEALALRMDARSDEPGGLTADGGSLCVRRVKKSGRDNPYVQVHDGLRQLLDVHRAWHKARYPESAWYFPGREVDSDRPVDVGVLTKALARLHRTKRVKKKITSHGLRAWYVLVRRSNGISETQIAWEINHLGGVGMLEKGVRRRPPALGGWQGPEALLDAEGRPGVEEDQAWLIVWRSSGQPGLKHPPSAAYKEV